MQFGLRTEGRKQLGDDGGLNNREFLKLASTL